MEELYIKFEKNTPRILFGMLLLFIFSIAYIIIDKSVFGVVSFYLFSSISTYFGFLHLSRIIRKVRNSIPVKINYIHYSFIDTFIIGIPALLLGSLVFYETFYCIYKLFINGFNFGEFLLRIGIFAFSIYVGKPIHFNQDLFKYLLRQRIFEKH